ncbi:NtaA/DmoA family FMN-dependent monooxygenase [Mycobacterium intracellulare]|uniref:NtaA/DmoA family FMN-dependent monooxygenase n=1 Tax=Mycobacterium intracellulare TaxID=1767 RepID=UPI001EED3D9F|nr:NtaA/DmoA family FMN-dependent monooxygenase [Mycobacterium intracellulare]MEE3750858.1 NtaA/DmoA family FMN-dependent monooxygenase [Mycobacterium intracellulare]
MSPQGSADGSLVLMATIMGLGFHHGAWRARQAPATDYLTAAMYQDAARTAERGKLHAVFLADTLTNAEEGTDRPALGAMDPAVVLAAMATVTDRVGLIGTASTTFTEPFELARRFATLDHLSGGRAGWNAVTTFVPDVAENFGGARLPDRAQRYDRAREFIDVVLGLWSSWDPGALIGDAASATFAAAHGVRPINHIGKHFRVKGPLPLPRTPQGRPAVIQAGSSAAGQDLAGRYSDVVFTAQNVLEAAINFRDKIRERARAHGREPDRVKVVPGLLAILGETDEDAHRRKCELDELGGVGPELKKLARRIGVPVSALDLDAPLPLHLLENDEKFAGSVGFRAAAVTLAVRERLTVRELLRRNGGGHLQVVGTAEQVADTIALWHRCGAADGFNLMIDSIPTGLVDAVERLVPVLQDRGLFHTDYAHTTLRANLGVADDRAQT